MRLHEIRRMTDATIIAKPDLLGRLARFINAILLLVNVKLSDSTDVSAYAFIGGTGIIALPQVQPADENFIRIKL